MTSHAAQLRMAQMPMNAKPDTMTEPGTRGRTSANGHADSRAQLASDDERIDRIRAAFMLHHRAIHRFLMVRTRNDSAVCDDLMQQVWLAACKGAASVSSDEIEFWLRGVAKRVLVTHIRKAVADRGRLAHANGPLARQIAADLVSTDGGSMNTAMSAEQSEQLLLAMTELPGADQDVLIGHYVRGVPQARLAEQLAVTERAIEGRLYRARTALRERLMKMDEEAVDGLDGAG